MDNDYGALNADIIYEREEISQFAFSGNQQISKPQMLLGQMYAHYWTRYRARAARIERMGIKRRLKVKLAFARRHKYRYSMTEAESDEYLSWFPKWKQWLIIFIAGAEDVALSMTGIR